MSSEKFTTGDVVELKSGGPEMTVAGVIAKTGEVVCAWFDDKDVPHQRSFLPGMLKKVEEPESID